MDISINNSKYARQENLENTQAVVMDNVKNNKILKEQIDALSRLHDLSMKVNAYRFDMLCDTIKRTIPSKYRPEFEKSVKHIRAYSNDWYMKEANENLENFKATLEEIEAKY